MPLFWLISPLVFLEDLYHNRLTSSRSSSVEGNWTRSYRSRQFFALLLPTATAAIIINRPLIFRRRRRRLGRPQAKFGRDAMPRCHNIDIGRVPCRCHTRELVLSGGSHQQRTDIAMFDGFVHRCALIDYFNHLRWHRFIGGASRDGWGVLFLQACSDR